MIAMGGLPAKKKKKDKSREARDKDLNSSLSASQSLRVKNAEVMILLCQVYHRRIPAGDKWKKGQGVSSRSPLPLTPPKLEDGTCYIPKHSLLRIFLQAMSRQCEGPQP